MKGEARAKLTINKPLSIAKISDDINVISLPELVSIIDFILNLPILSNMLIINVFLSYTAKIEDLKK